MNEEEVKPNSKVPFFLYPGKKNNGIVIDCSVISWKPEPSIGSVRIMSH